MKYEPHQMSTNLICQLIQKTASCKTNFISVIMS